MSNLLGIVLRDYLFSTGDLHIFVIVDFPRTIHFSLTATVIIVQLAIGPGLHGMVVPCTLLLRHSLLFYNLNLLRRCTHIFPYCVNFFEICAILTAPK